MLTKYYSLVERAKNQDFIQHYLEKYGRLPIWVACEILDFGALSRLYNLLKPEDREFIAKKYKTNAKLFLDWLKSLNFIRNTCAHHARLWNINIAVRIDTCTSFPNHPNLKNQKTFPYFMLMQHFLSIISPTSKWKERLITLIEQEFPIPQNQAIHITDFGCPSSYKKILQNL